MEESTCRVEHTITWGVAASIYRRCAQVAGQKLLIIDPSHRALSKFYSVLVFVGRNPPAGSNCGSSLSAGFLNNESSRFMLGGVRGGDHSARVLSAPTN